MTVPSDITTLSTTASSNPPAGSDAVFPDLDNHLRAVYSFIATNYAAIIAGAAADALTGTALASGVVTSSLTSVAADCTDGTNELGYKGLPAASVTTGAFVAADRGKCVYATGGVTIPDATMSAGDVVTILNTTGTAITLTASITNLVLAGTSTTGDRTLAQYGIASLIFSSGTLAFISGTGLT